MRQPRALFMHLRPSRRRYLNGASVSALLFFGVVLSILLFIYVRSWEDRALRAQITNHAQERVEILRAKIASSMDVLRSIDSLFATERTISRPQFASFVSSALRLQPELCALGWTPRVTASERQAFEDSARRDGIAGFQFVEQDAAGKIVRASEKAEYFPIYYLEPSEPNHRALGFELDSNPLRREALQQAMKTGQPTATDPMHLLQGERERYGFVVYLAVVDAASGTDRSTRSLKGYASAVFWLDDLLGRSLSDLAGQGLAAQIADASIANGPIYKRGAEGILAAKFEGSASIDIAGRHWTLSLTPNARFVTTHTTQNANLLLAASLLITLLVAFCLYGGVIYTARIEHRVVVRTAELSRQVAERKRAEQAARLAEIKYRSIFENSVEGIFQTSLTGQYLSANRALAQMYGYESPDQLISSLPNIAHQLYVMPGRRDDFIRQAQRDGIVSNFESQARRRDGKVIWISENARAVRGEGGEVLFYEGTVVEVTARKEAEELIRTARAELETRVAERTRDLDLTNRALQEEIAVRQKAEESAATANRAKSDFLARMSHEIRTPMNAILGYAQLLQRDRPLSEKQRRAINTIMSSGRHLLGLIDDVLDLSKIEAGHVELEFANFNLKAMLADVTAMLRARAGEKGISLTADLACDPNEVVRGDERKLRQILINLIGNAVKFTSAGRVELRVRRRMHDQFQFEVIDTGVGIDPEAQQFIFEPFRQGAAGRHRGGTGLGLAIAKHYVELLGGELCCQSTLGQGARFHFCLSLPVSSERSLTISQLDTSRGLLPLRCDREVRALVVDDLPENREVLAEILKQVGCTVVTAADGKSGLEHATAEVFDIAFIDILMPDLDGLQVAAQIRNAQKRCAAAPVKLIAVTASAFSHERDRWLCSGFDDVIAKPVLAGRLYQLLAAIADVTLHPVLEEAGLPDREASGRPGLLPSDCQSLSKSLRTRIISAAELYSVTDLRRCIDDAERETAPPHELCRTLRRLLHDYDMEQVIRLVRDEQSPLQVDAGGRWSGGLALVSGGDDVDA